MILRHGRKPLPRYGRWIDWFAWYPVWANNEHGQEKLVWLEFAEFKRVEGLGGDDDTIYYRFTERNT